MEYRRVGNSCHSTDAILAPGGIQLSPCKVLNQMLWAGKVQNKEDLSQIFEKLKIVDRSIMKARGTFRISIVGSKPSVFQRMSTSRMSR